MGGCDGRGRDGRVCWEWEGVLGEGGMIGCDGRE